MRTGFTRSAAFLLHAMLVSIVQAACAEGAADASVPDGGLLEAPRAEWRARPAPVEIGVTEGEAPYLLHDAVSSLRFADGRIAVLDGSSRQIRFFAADGAHLASVGGKGDGPGEYRWPLRLYLTHSDSILVWDMGTGRETRLDGHGRFVWSEPWTAPEGEAFPRDAWLYRRNVIDGPRTPAGRPAIRAILDRLPPLEPARFRHAKVDDHARLWVRAMPADPSSETEWQVWGIDGSALARVKLPAGFEPQHIGPDFVTGRAWNDMNVESIQLYTIDGAITPAAPHGAPSAAAAPSSPGVASAGLRDRMLAVLRHMMSQQEMYYSVPANGYTYASRADALTWPEDLMEGLIPHILEGTPRGWAMLLFHESENVACGVKQGGGGPIGWTGGIAICQ
ncbi:MAG: 6-bladed beta-propeller [Gemmatimonadetes bacterium]|nr:6-bladed beta-propeller [Gemmatimonadota bacterium]